jgi:single-strand DNA-binding protein
MNNVVLSGRLTKDPEVRYASGEEPMAIARFTLAVDRRKKEGEQSADFISCVAFRKQGEFVEKYCKQGTKIILAGHIQTGSYTNKQGVKVYTTEVIVDALEFAESKKSEGKAEGAKPDNGFENIEDIPEELPFD